MKLAGTNEVTAVTAAVVPIRAGRTLAARVIDTAQAVHRDLGPGLESLFYSRALALELQAGGIAFRREVWIDIRFRGTSLGRRRLAFLLDDLAVETVSTEHVEVREVQRLRAVAHAAGVAAAVLLNFGVEPLEIRRVENEPTTLK